MRFSFYYKFDQFHDKTNFKNFLVHNDLSSSIFKYLPGSAMMMS